VGAAAVPPIAIVPASRITDCAGAKVATAGSEVPQPAKMALPARRCRNSFMVKLPVVNRHTAVWFEHRNRLRRTMRGLANDHFIATALIENAHQWLLLEFKSRSAKRFCSNSGSKPTPITQFW
jgi:hypothetical protein